MTNHSLPLTHLTEINTFLVIVEVGSFSLAAEKLGISRAHVSRQLKQLESQLNTQLLMRTTRTQRLTQEGEIFYGVCKASLSKIQDAIHCLHQIHEDMTGHIAINCVGGIIGEQVITQSLNHFIQQYPAINIELDFSSERIDMHRTKHDLVFRMGELEDSPFIARKIADVNIGLYASPNYIQQIGKPLHPKDLKQHNCLTGSIRQWQFIQASNSNIKESVEVKGQFVCKNGYALLHAALTGNGICRLPELYCLSHVTAGALIPIFDDWKIKSAPLHLLYHANKYQPLRLKKLIQYLLNELPKQFIPNKLDVAENQQTMRFTR